jgi:hypothetical protein
VGGRTGRSCQAKARLKNGIPKRVNFGKHLPDLSKGPFDRNPVFGEHQTRQIGVLSLF